MPTALLRPRVLVAEDDPQLRKLLSLLLRRTSDVEFTAVADGADALQLLHEERYDILLLDLMMPRVNGYEVIDAIARMPRPWPAVIVLSAALTTSHLNPEVVTVVIRKPFDIEVLAAVFEETAQSLAAAATGGGSGEIVAFPPPC